jgi:hypothetical protein
MYLGIALLLIFVLYLIDKHHLWRKVAKIGLYCVLALGLAAAGLFIWLRHKEKQQEAESAAYAARMKPIWDCEARNANFSNADEECEKDPNVVLQPITITPAPTRPPQPAPTKRPELLGNAQVVPDFALLFGCNSSTLITTMYHGARVKIMSHQPSGAVQVQIPDGRIGCFLEEDDVQPDKSLSPHP